MNQLAPSMPAAAPEFFTAAELAHIIDHTLNTAYQWEHLNQVRSARLLGISRNVLRTHLKRMELID